MTHCNTGEHVNIYTRLTERIIITTRQQTYVIVNTWSGVAMYVDCGVFPIFLSWTNNKALSQACGVSISVSKNRASSHHRRPVSLDLDKAMQFSRTWAAKEHEWSRNEEWYVTPGLEDSKTRHRIRDWLDKMCRFRAAWSVFVFRLVEWFRVQLQILHQIKLQRTIRMAGDKLLAANTTYFGAY